MDKKWLVETLGRGLALLAVLSVIGWVVESAYLFYLAPANFFVSVSKIAGLVAASAVGAFVLGSGIRGLEKLLSNKKPAPENPATPESTPPADPTIPAM